MRGDVVYLKDRKLSRDRVARLASCDWVEACETVVIISKTGCGKSFLGQALGNAACRRRSSPYATPAQDIMEDLNRRVGGRRELLPAHGRLQDRPAAHRRRLHDHADRDAERSRPFEIMEAREGRAATLIASQLEPNEWYLRIEG